MTRVPATLQVAQTECGLCCARSVLAHHGRDLSLLEMRTVIEPGRDGLSLKQIGQLLSAQKLQTRMYRVRDPRGLDNLPTPFIAYWRNNHFVVVDDFGSRRAKIMDPASGRQTVTRESFDDDFSGYVLLAEPKEDFEGRKRPALANWRGKPIWPKKSGGNYFLLAVLSLAVLAFTLAIPTMTQKFVDAASGTDFSLGSAMLGIALAALGYITTQLARTYVTTNLTRRVSWQLLSGAFERLIRLPIAFFMNRPPGELMYRLNSLNQVRDILATQVVQGVLDILTVAVLVLYIFSVSAQLGLIALALASLVVIALWATRRLIKNATDREVNETAKSQSLQLDAIVSITSVRVGGYASTYLNDWKEAYSSALDAMVTRTRIQQAWAGSLVGGIQGFAPLSLMIISFAWAQDGRVTIGQSIAVQGVSGLLFGLSTSLFQAFTQITVAGSYLERADEIYGTKPERSGGSATSLPHGGLRLDDVSFRYTDHSPAVLEDISLNIPPGSTLAIVGESGSGKSTLGKIIASLYEPTSGTVRYGGIEHQTFNLDSLRQNIGYLPQEGYLHNRTIVANLILGTQISEAEAITFGESLDFLDFVKTLPMGYQTVVAEMGQNLSGGQRQRVLMAKALLRRPQILVMDEATSALDNRNQWLIQDKLQELDCTQVIIAHRLSTVEHADSIAVLQNGHLVEQGTHAELLARDGVYTSMYRQSADQGLQDRPSYAGN